MWHLPFSPLWYVLDHKKRFFLKTATIYWPTDQTVNQDATRIKMQRGSRYNEDQDATRIKMQRRSICNKDHDAMRIKMQRGSRCKEDQDSTRIKMQRGLSCIFSTFLNVSWRGHLKPYIIYVTVLHHKGHITAFDLLIQGYVFLPVINVGRRKSVLKWENTRSV